MAETDKKNRRISQRIIGIDLGTTNTIVSYVENGKIFSIPAENGQRLIPSIVAVDKNRKIVVGSQAERQKVANPSDTFYSIKRLLGRDSKNIDQVELRNLFFETDLSSEKIGIKSTKLARRIECEEISAYILMKVKEIADDFFEEDISRCIITVPAYFDNSQRKATLTAAKIANLNVIRLINEPSAAAIAYEFKDKIDHDILVADLGGGTFDLSLVSVTDNSFYEVKASSGDTQLGGDDFTRNLYEFLLNDFEKKDLKVDLNPSIVAMIFAELEKAKKEISFNEEVTISFPFLIGIDKQLINYEINIDLNLFNEINKIHIEKIRDLIGEFLVLEKIRDVEITDVILVGGASRMKCFQNVIREFVEIAPKSDVNPDEVVSNGAALSGEILDGNSTDKIISDVTPLSLGCWTVGDIFNVQIPRNSTIPVSQTHVYTTLDDFQESCDVRIFQGERPIASDNLEIGNMVIRDIELARRGLPQIEVEFEIDVDGVLNVTAIDQKTKSKCNVTINGSQDLSDKEVENIRSIAENYFDEDGLKLRKSQASLQVMNLSNLIKSKKTINSEVQNVLNKAEMFISNPLEYKGSYYELIEEMKDLLDGV